MSRVLVWKYLG